MKISIVIPVFNEADTILTLLDRVMSVELPDREIIVVDDGSWDGTGEKLNALSESASPTVKVVFHEKNKGKGASLRSGFAIAKGDIIIIQDADLEYNPDQYLRLLAPIL